MSKADAIDALTESAIRHFAHYGYEGASLRDIANEAGAPLSTIDRYFGSKAELSRAVMRKVWSEVEKDRDVILKAATKAAPEGRPQLADLIHALAKPIVQRALSKSEGDVARTYLLRNGLLDDGGSSSGDLPGLSNAVRSLARWIDAMMLTCPTLSRQDVVWVFSYSSGLIFSRQLIHHQYDMLFVPEGEPTVEEVTDDIVAFSCAGVEAIIQRRSKTARPKAAAS